MNLIEHYEKLTQNLCHNSKDNMSLCALIDLYPQAKNAFDYEIANSIELFVDNLGHTQANVDYLTQKIKQSQNSQEKSDFAELLDRLFTVKISILNELESYQNYTDIEKFFRFIIKLKTSKNIEEAFLVKLLTALSGEMNQETLAYGILTDTLDYMTGWQSKSLIESNLSIANFIKNLKNNPRK